MERKELSSKIFDVVGVIGRYVAEHWEGMAILQEIEEELLDRGFQLDDIDRAFRWIEQKTLDNEHGPRNAASMIPLSACRPLDAIERCKIRPAAYRVLAGAYLSGYVDDLQFENIVERALRSESEDVRAKEMRRIVALTLFQRYQTEWSRLLDSPSSNLHVH